MRHKQEREDPEGRGRSAIRSARCAVRSGLREGGKDQGVREGRKEGNPYVEGPGWRIYVWGQCVLGERRRNKINATTLNYVPGK